MLQRDRVVVAKYHAGALQALRLSDGRYLQCYMWQSKRAFWCSADEAPLKAWRGTIEEAWKIKDQWGSFSGFSCPLQIVPFPKERR